MGQHAEHRRVVASQEPAREVRGLRRTRLLAVLRHPLAFLLRVLRGMARNRALLLSGALAYNALLTLIPFFTLLLLVLSSFMDEASLLAALEANLEILLPGESGLVVDQVRQVLNHRELISGFTVLVLLFFSGSAFMVFQHAMSLIFEHRFLVWQRTRLMSFVIPWLYSLLLGAGFVVLALVTGALTAMQSQNLALFGEALPLQGVSTGLLHLFGFVTEVLIFTSLYAVMPVGRLRIRQAFVGGFAAALLWEPVRHLLAWYFTTFSAVNVLYGSVGTVVIVLILMEIGALVILFGAQIIAEYERFVYRESFFPRSQARRTRLGSRRRGRGGQPTLESAVAAGPKRAGRDGDEVPEMRA